MTKLTHLDAAGNAAMVDVSAKPATEREALAEGRITMSAEALAAIDTTSPEARVLISGSLYLAGSVLRENG